MTAWHETALLTPCGDSHLIGILSSPEQPATTGVLIVVGGPQYRVGSHRQFVLLARRIADAGHVALRFDVRGMGDSSGEPKGFESITEDIDAMLNALRTHAPGLQRIALWGLCDGASAALLYCAARPSHGLTALILANPWVRTETSQARTQIKHYYFDRLKQRSFWRKLVSGGVELAAVGELVQSLCRAVMRHPSAGVTRVPRVLTYTQRMAHAWRGFPGPIALILSGNDYTAKEFIEHTAHSPEWRGLLQSPRVQRTDVPDADHTFASIAASESATLVCLKFLRELS